MSWSPVRFSRLTISWELRQAEKEKAGEGGWNFNGQRGSFY